MMSAEALSLLAVALTLAAHLVTTVWWAASITRRVDHIEKWITLNERTAERLAALEMSLNHISDGIARIEELVRCHSEGGMRGGPGGGTSGSPGSGRVR